ncbi:hypothetical protein [Amycolatopsis thermoflava]|uniref:hypothetical protein n=1 Tax=Amycolatopsis thermoflava TaxID=84480 RepID=UPI003653B140
MAATEDSNEPAGSPDSTALVPLDTRTGSYRLTRKQLLGEETPMTHALKALGREQRVPVSIPVNDALTSGVMPALLEQAGRHLSEALPTSSLIEHAAGQLIDTSLVTANLADLVGPSLSKQFAAQVAGVSAISRIGIELPKPALSSALADIGGLSGASLLSQQFRDLSVPIGSLLPTTTWFAHSHPLIDLGESVRKLIRDALTPSWRGLSGFERLEQHWLLWAAARTRHLLLTEPDAAKTNAAVEDFVYRKVGVSRPARREEREAIRDAAIEVLLSSNWLAGEVAELDQTDGELRKHLRTRIFRASAVYKPVWHHQIRGRWIGSLDESVLTDAGETTLAALVRDAGDPLAAVGGPITDPRLLSLIAELNPQQRAVVVARAHHGNVSWAEAAELAGVDTRHGESARRKVRNLLRGQEQRARLKESA